MITKNNIQFYEFEGFDGFQAVRGSNVNNNFSCHIHRKACIGTLESGRAIFSVRGKEYIINKGDTYFIDSNEPHSMKSIDENGFSYIVLCFESLSNFYNEDIKFNESVVKDYSLGNKLTEAFSCIIKSDLSIERECILFDILEYILPYCTFNTGIKLIDIGINKACDFINDNLTRKINLSDLAAAANMSKFHFVRLFQKKIGITPYDYLLQARIKLSKDMLLKDSSITDVALELGFTDQSHFTKLFKKFTGITPAEYLKNNITM